MHKRTLGTLTLIVTTLAAVLGQWGALFLGLVLLAAERGAWPARPLVQAPV